MIRQTRDELLSMLGVTFFYFMGEFGSFIHSEIVIWIGAAVFVVCLIPVWRGQ